MEKIDRSTAVYAEPFTPTGARPGGFGSVSFGGGLWTWLTASITLRKQFMAPTKQVQLLREAKFATLSLVLWVLWVWKAPA